MDADMGAVYVTDDGGEYDIEFERSYGLFAWLADVRNYSRIKPLSKPRGLPDDVEIVCDDGFDDFLSLEKKSDPSKPIKLDYRFDMLGCYSWYTLAELEAVDYDQEIEDFRGHKPKDYREDDEEWTPRPSTGHVETLREFLALN